MDQQDIQMGPVTYQIRREFLGEQPIEELVMARMEQAYLEHPAFDGGGKDAL